MLINRNNALFYTTKNNEIHQGILIFVIWKKPFPQIWRKNIGYCYKNGPPGEETASKKEVHKLAKAIIEFVGNKIDEKIVKPNENSKNVEEINIPPERREEILNRLTQVL